MFGQPELGALASRLEEGLERWSCGEHLEAVRALYRELLAAC